ncbi:MAG: hypothetical protein GWO08_22040 [Gammaproteobacteria bacterium]|nr:hypothetical protein [Gammaproteobacteria bacterium]NIN62949.1 hypothetical protein [Gammaproteobacteria bacterium]NIO63930.1 hypothetical protein [Gammaproteobacteria bacterium]NIP50308.1 hypothetical protein [Gammaproteobacteria bacterium]NIQ12528.1 hypothetical protein [Gammaproteobacteria bacterium]
MIGHEIKISNLAENIEANITYIVTTFNQYESIFKTASTEHHVSKISGLLAGQYYSSIACSFINDDLGRIKQLINELGRIISETNNLSKSDKTSLLGELKIIRPDLDKGSLDLDRFWQQVEVADGVLDKLGKDAECIAERIREIAVIAWHTPLMYTNYQAMQPRKVTAMTRDTDTKVIIKIRGEIR